MKFYFGPFLCIMLLTISCKEAIKKEVASNEITEKIDFGAPDITKNTVVYTKADLLGFWVGDFTAVVAEGENVLGENEFVPEYNHRKKITFSIDKIIENVVKGHTVVEGNLAEFEGTLSENNTTFTIQVKEVGNANTDGIFKLVIAKYDSKLTGSWEAFHANNVIYPKKKLELSKRFFKYSPKYALEGRFVDTFKTKMLEQEFEDEDSLGNPIVEKYEDKGYFTTTEAVYEINPSLEVLKKEAVENLSKADIHVLRNLIFARHGYTFKNKPLRYFFDLQEWYIPVKSDVKADLTAIEKKNIELLMRYEQNAKEYYDVFGR